VVTGAVTPGNGDGQDDHRDHHDHHQGEGDQDHLTVRQADRTDRLQHPKVAATGQQGQESQGQDACGAKTKTAHLFLIRR
jgi:hypothetical protein